MEIKSIKSEQDYDKALARLKSIFHADVDTPEGKEAEELSFLIEKYENEHHPLVECGPTEEIKFRKEEYNAEIDEALEDSANGRMIKATDLKLKIQKWD